MLLLRDVSAIGAVYIAAPAATADAVIASARLHASLPFDPLALMEVSIDPAPGLELQTTYPVPIVFATPGGPSESAADVTIVYQLKEPISETELAQQYGTFLGQSAPGLVPQTSFERDATGQLFAATSRGTSTAGEPPLHVEARLVIGSEGVFFMIARTHDPAWREPLAAMLHSFRPTR